MPELQNSLISLPSRLLQCDVRLSLLRYGRSQRSDRRPIGLAAHWKLLRRSLDRSRLDVASRWRTFTGYWHALLDRRNDQVFLASETRGPAKIWALSGRTVRPPRSVAAESRLLKSVSKASSTSACSVRMMRRSCALDALRDQQAGLFRQEIVVPMAKRAPDIVGNGSVRRAAANSPRPCERMTNAQKRGPALPGCQ
jgi:hypothetical protein